MVTNLYFPALPVLIAAFQVEPAMAQLVGTSFLAAIGLSQLFLSPLGDHFGRRRVLLLFFSLFAFATLMCAFVDDINTLILLRVLQGIGASAGFVLARAIARDINTTEKATSRTVSYLVMTLGLGSIVFPVAWGAVIQNAGWRSAFGIAALLIVVVTVWAYLTLPETAPTIRERGRFINTLSESFTGLFRSRRFIGNALTLAFTTAIFILYISVVPVILGVELAYPPQRIGLFLAGTSVVFLAGAVLNGLIVERYGTEQLIRGCALGMAVAGIAFMVLMMVVKMTVTLLFWSFAPLLFLIGVINPAVLAACISVDPDRAGAAAGFSSAISLGLGAVAAQLATAYYDGTGLSLGIGVAIAAAGVIGSWSLLRSR